MVTPARIRLSSKDRQRLAKFSGLDAGTAKADLDRLETILNDHRFITGVFESPKPNEVQDLIAPGKGAGLRKKAQALAEALDAVPWQVSAEYTVSGFDLRAFQRQLQRFTAASDAVIAFHAGEKTPRRAPQRVRDRHTIPEIVDLFNRMCGHEDDGERDWDHIDHQCVFVTLALECAGIPCPDAGDTSPGEMRQGRLRRLLKAYAEKKRRARRQEQHAS